MPRPSFFRQDILDFINARIVIADQLIVGTAVAKVVDGDVILTFAYSHVVGEVLLEAAKQRKEFRVVVVDARPESEGRQMLQVCATEGTIVPYRYCIFMCLTASLPATLTSGF